ncbi:hypothetical protein [Streptomyces sp. NRRL B-24484]|uniref:hypothetical protein n=1 Tax=Streptomyces sp. NRRL B-24484 TaxID=1463833 RepID=UPI0004C24F1E|nr:hypothetical protein [Streptomyces sp. NRRL B-24484]
MPVEESFTTALRSAAELAPEPNALFFAQGAATRGVRRRRRRRAAVLAGAAAVAAAVLAAGSLPALHGDRAPAAQPWSSVSGEYMRDALVSLLPNGRVTGAMGFTGNEGDVTLGPSAVVDLETAHTGGQISLGVDRIATPVTESSRGAHCFDPSERPTQSCSRTVRPDGSVLMVNVLLPERSGAGKVLVATYTRPDGRQVRVDTYNRDGRPEPPLTVEQAVAVVTSGAWDVAFDGVRVTDPPNPGVSLPPAAALHDAVAKLLPAGAVAGPADGLAMPGRVRLQVSLEGRTSWVAVDVEPHWQQGGEADPRTVFESGRGPELTHTADGTSVVAGGHRESDGADGPEVQWSAEALHPDGTRVTVNEWNGPDARTFLPGAPALTVDRLRALATAPAWRG